MDKNKILGFLFLAIAFWLMTKMPEPESRYVPSGSGASSATGGMSATGSITSNSTPTALTPVQTEIALPKPSLNEPAKFYKLGVPGQYQATLTSIGGAIQEIRFLGEENRFRKFDPVLLEKLEGEKTVILLQTLNQASVSNDLSKVRKLERQARKQKMPLQWIAAAKTQTSGNFDAQALTNAHTDYVLNEGMKRPILEVQFNGLDGKLPFALAEQTDQSITFVGKLGDLTITRRYEVVPDTFQIQHTTTLRNTGQQKINLGSQVLYGLGSSHPTVSDTRSEFQNVGYYAGQRGWTGRRKPPIFKLHKMQKEGGELVENAGGIHWAAVRNQFFAMTLAPEKPTSGLVKGKVFDLGKMNHRGDPEYGVLGQLGLNTDELNPGEEIKHKLTLYAGPKELKRLNQVNRADGQKLKHQDLVMQFGFFGLFSKLLLMLMQALYGLVNNWGWAIILMTIIIKLLFWPLTAKASESQKRMQKISAPMKEIQAKYKDKPHKMQQEVQKLFRENKVNPAAGCLPILIQMPIFLGLFFMLRSAAELRHADFLWVTDLSQPERLLHWGVNIPLLGEFFNILPILMGLTMFFQMRMTPIPPGADEMQQMQAKMFRFLPFIFLFMLYGFSSGLVLYWTVQNVLTIIQQTITNRKKDTEPIVLPGNSKKKKNSTS